MVRVQYLGILPAAESNHLGYELLTRQFSTAASLEIDELDVTAQWWRRVDRERLCDGVRVLTEVMGIAPGEIVDSDEMGAS